MRHLNFMLSTGVVFLMACSSDSGSVADPPGGNNGPDPQDPVSSATVTAGSSSNTFTPPTVDLLEGGTVTWNFGTLGHNVTFDGTAGAPDNIPTTTDASFSRTFPTTGEFDYDCTVHPGMSGLIRVH